jgi:hypothetical protein
MQHTGLSDLANRINVWFQKSQNYRVTAGKHLIEAQQRVRAGEAGAISWEAWLTLNIKRSLADCRKCMALAKAPDPEVAAAAERMAARVRMQKRRANVRAAPSNQVVDPLTLLLDAWDTAPEYARREFLRIVDPARPFFLDAFKFIHIDELGTPEAASRINEGGWR